VCHVPGPRGNSLGYFCPRRASSQCFSQASGDAEIGWKISAAWKVQMVSWQLAQFAAKVVDFILIMTSGRHLPRSHFAKLRSPWQYAFSEKKKKSDQAARRSNN